MPKSSPSGADCYATVAGDATRLWASRRATYVAPDDAAYKTYATLYRTLNFESELVLSKWLDGFGVIGPLVLPRYVNAERDRRIAAGFLFGDHVFQSDVASQKRIAGAVSLAILAIGAGKQAGDMLWHGGETPFSWLAADNTAVPMDAQTVVLFGKTAGAWEYEHVIAARALKDMSPTPRDFTDDKHWPQKAA